MIQWSCRAGNAARRIDMHLFHFLAQRGPLRVRVHVLLSILAAILFAIGTLSTEHALSQRFQVRPGRVQVAGQDIAAGVYLPSDRSLSRAITRARERLADHEYHEVLAFLQGVL